MSTIRARAGRACLFAGLLACAAAAEAYDAIRLTDRDMEIHFGTQTQTGAFSETTHFLQPTDFIPEELRQAILDDSGVDPRVGPNLASWVSPGVMGIAWSLDTPEGRAAAANLLQDLSSVPAGRTVVNSTIESPQDLGTRNYFLGEFETIETAPVFVGDSDDPVVFGEEGQNVTILNRFEANVRFVERNATLEVEEGFGCQVLDTFNQTPAKLAPANWAGAKGIAKYRVVGNTVRVEKGGKLYWRANDYGTTQRACVTVTQLCPTGFSKLLLKVQGTQPKGAIVVFHDAKAKKIGIRTFRPGIGWKNLAKFPAKVGDGDVLGAEALPDGQVQVYVNGEPVGQADAGSWFGDRGGRVGLWFHDTCKARPRFDDFGGG